MKTSLFNNYKVNLIESLEDIEIMKSQFSKDIMVGCDTETTGLSYLTDKIVGYCFSTGKSYSVNDYQGYYLPVRHLNYNNLPLDKVVEVTQWVLDNFKVCFFNRPFDFSMMELDGIHCPFVGHTHDAQIMAFLVTGESFPALKPSVKKYLKLDIIEFSDNNATDHNFGTTDPTVTYVYAANDPLITVLLARKLWSEYPYIRKIYPIDNKAGEAVRKFAKETLVYLNYDILDKESESVNFQIQELKNKIFSFVGYQFKLNSTRDKGDALCFSEDTEFLTEKGFLHYDDITTEKLAQYNVNTNEVEYVLPEGRISRSSEDMYHINHRYTDLLVTPGHNMFVALNKNDYKLIPIDNICNRSRGFRVKNTFNFAGVERVDPFIFESSKKSKVYKRLEIPADAFIEFLGFWYGDGHSTIRSYNGKDGRVHTTYKVGLTQSTCKEKEETVKWLMDLNNRMGNVFGIHKRAERYDFQCALKEFAEYMEYECKVNKVKTIPLWVRELSLRQRRLFLDGYLRADGTFNGANVFLSSNKELLEELKFLSVISGRKCSDIQLKTEEGKITSVKGVSLKNNSKPMYKFSSVVKYDYSHIIPNDIEYISHYHGRVVCFQVPSSVLVVRRNGKVSVCGNCRYVTLTQKTKKGQFEVGKEVLAKIDHPLAKMLLEYAKLEKYRGSYIDKMKEFPRDGFHVNYSTVNVSCLTKSNKVQTSRGLISVTDVVENDLILTRFGYKRVLWKKSFYDDTLKISFKNGSFIEGNAKHPVLVGDKWVGLGDLKLGNHVKILSDTHFHPSEVKLPEFVQDSYARKLINFSLTVDAELASCFGFIDGDGSLVPDGVKLCFSEFEPEVEQYYIKLFSDRFNMELPSRSIGNDHTVQYKFCSSSLSRYLKSLRLKPHGLEQGIDISQWSSECQLAYVAALFDTDGSVNRSGKNYNLRLSMTSKGCIDNVVSVLRFHGIDVHEFIVSSNRKQPLYSLRVRGRQSVLRFISLVTPFMRCLHKFERLLEYQCLIADSKSPWDKYQDSTTVVNIEQTGYQEVIDIEVEDCHEFIANGIVTHNTGRMSSGSSKGNPYFENLNIQNIPKVEVYRYLHRGSVLGYFADDNSFEPIAQETLDQCEPFEIISQEQVGTKKLYKITKDDGTVLSLCEGTYVKISRDGKRLYEAVENLKSGDELL